ncbi:hypothetical protein KQX54_009834 [Cotesia glomerata]|uniref:Uncharacterized protein n=1 Tax=Cotesia glomerata TaxID=32391 RepID=A0AAV7J4F4_COTGL|nr:hypothetical protein KQX54_009834 [Cotesia glomerata]
MVALACYDEAVSRGHISLQACEPSNVQESRYPYPHPHIQTLTYITLAVEKGKGPSKDKVVSMDNTTTNQVQEVTASVEYRRFYIASLRVTSSRRANQGLGIHVCDGLLLYCIRNT